jgi:hypothetical protein
MPDYIPRKDDKFNDWYSVFHMYVEEKTGGNFPEWTFIPSDELSDFQFCWTEWNNAWRDTLGPHDEIKTEIKIKARIASEKNIRPFVKRFMHFPPVTDEDRVAMGIPNYTDERTKPKPPKTAPEILPDTSTRRRIIAHYRDEGSDKRGKPQNVHGIEILWAILDHPPVDLSELVHSAFSTRSPLVLEFEEHERGKRIYMVGRWEIIRDGEKGPFGAIVEAIIP